MLDFAPRPDEKPTNPKDAVGSNKIPLHLVPYCALVYIALAMLHGLLKYGRGNWRPGGVRASIYIAALLRHAFAWDSGEDDDPESGLSHLAHMGACVAILIEAKENGNLVDDRQYPTGYVKMVERMTPHVARLKEKFADRSPKHWTIADAPPAATAEETR